MTTPGVRTWAAGRYEHIALLGRGSSGLVYRVLDRESGLLVALKTLVDFDSENIYRLKQEFRACAGVRHRNLVELYELYVAADECFFTMELVEGVDFVRFVRDPTGSPDGQLLRFLAAARQLMEGLAALHAAGRLHRDVKPSNCLVDAHGRAVLLDFGFAIPFGSQLLAVERSDTIAGSLAYMAPEVLCGEPASPASDWYAAGVLFHEALSGALPFSGPPRYLLSGGARPEPPALPAHVPALLGDLVRALLAANPGERLDASAVAHVLDDCSVEQAATSSGPPAPLATETAFVGRGAELRAMHEALEKIRPDRTSVVHVSGPSGIGKSELVRRFLATIERDGDTVALRGRCHPYETVPYRAFDGVMDAISRYLSSLADLEGAGLVPRHAGALLRLFPVLGRLPLFADWRDRDDSEDALELRRRGFAAIRELLARLGDRRRLVVWLDDVQWADADSAALAREVFGGRDAPRLLLVLTYRSDDRDAAQSFAAFERREGDDALSRVTIELGPLRDDEVSELAAHIGQGRVANIGTLVSEAGGSPFLVTQLVRRATTTTASRTFDTLSLSDLLQARAAQLPSSARDLLEIVCVAGQPLELRLAAAAGALAGRGRHELISLQEDRLLRLSSTAGTHVEAYHDRIREAVVSGLPADVLRSRHRSLANVLIREAEPDAPALYRHFLGAGEPRHAATWALESAERADRALAFGEAAAFYRAALDLHEGAAGDRRALQVKLANALVNAGRGAEAAPIFIAAAAGEEELRGLDLRRRAAEQYMQTGRLGEGVASMQALLTDLGLAYPTSERGAQLGVVGGLIGVALRSLRPGLRALPLTDRNRLQIESVRSAAKGLAMVDPLRGLYFAVRALALALRSGDPYLIARELAGVGATLVPVGAPLRGWASRCIRRSREMAEALDDPYLLGFTSIIQAQERMVEGAWAEMLACCDAGAEILRARCRGVSWELAIAGAAAERALEELGQPPELLRRAEAALPRARDTADIVRICSCLQYIGIAHLLQGHLPQARDAAQQARATWPGQTFQLQHFYSLRLETYAALLDAQPENAQRLLEKHWPDLIRSQLLRHSLIGLDAHLLASRVHLAMAWRTGDDEPLRRALRHARTLGRTGTPASRGHQQMLEAGVAAVHGDHARSARTYALAAELFASANMRLARAAALHQLERVDVRNAHDRWRNESHALFAEAGVHDVAGHMRLHGVLA